MHDVILKRGNLQ